MEITQYKVRYAHILCTVPHCDGINEKLQSKCGAAHGSVSSTTAIYWQMPFKSNGGDTCSFLSVQSEQAQQAQVGAQAKYLYHVYINIHQVLWADHILKMIEKWVKKNLYRKRVLLIKVPCPVNGDFNHYCKCVCMCICCVHVGIHVHNKLCVYTLKVCMHVRYYVTWQVYYMCE